MAGQSIPQQRLQVPHELTPRDDAKKMVSEILKRVDQLIRKNDLDLAQAEITRAKELDPRNVYALALEERISILRTELEPADEPHHAEKTVSPLELQKLASQAPPSTPAAISEISSQHRAVEIPVLTSSTYSSPAPPEIVRKQAVDRSIALEAYRKALTDVWREGVVSEREEQQLTEMREVWGISKAEHEGIEHSVKRECYKHAILQQLSNHPSARSLQGLAELRLAFRISEDEHVQIQTQLMNAMQHKQREKILVIDDDMRLLELLASSLEDSGFDVTALPTSDEAFALLRKFIPDLILCDINLETSTMGGFTFYEKVQEIKHVQHVPFIFLTGLTDEALVRTGKELGVDDYLMKPISEQTLVSTLRGKLKRFRQLKRLAEQPAVASLVPA
jgi:CheY-like chemotaxis protein